MTICLVGVCPLLFVRFPVVVQNVCAVLIADKIAFHAKLNFYTSLDASIKEKVKFDNVLINEGNG